METKKRLIRRLAVATVATLVVALALAAGLGAFVQVNRVALDEELRRERAAAVEEARADLTRTAARISKVPVDPALVGSIQSEHPVDASQRRRYLWAVDTSDGFLFGVPREDFARLNALFDEHEASFLGGGYFVDRQDVLRKLIQASEQLEVHQEQAGSSAGGHDPWARWRHEYQSERWLVLSTPLTAGERALGNLFMKVEMPVDIVLPAELRAADDGAAILLGVAAAAGLFLWFLLPTWVYVDARGRGVERPHLWIPLVLISLFLGLVVYLIARPERGGTLACPACGRDVTAAAYCPHCGHDLSAAICDSCRSPLQPDWHFCPSCRTRTTRAEPEQART